MAAEGCRIPASPINIHKYGRHERCKTGNRKMENVNCTPRTQVESARSRNGWSCENENGNGNASALKFSICEKHQKIFNKFQILFMAYSFRLGLGWLVFFGLNTRRTKNLIGCA